jgi:CHRD domain-containing protein
VRRLIALGVLVAAAGTLPALALGTAAKTVRLEAKLAGKNEVPKAGGARGEAYVQITGTKVCWQFQDLHGFTGATASHIHKAPVGTAGPIVVPFGGAFKKTGCTTAPAGVTRGIVANPRAYYVNIHTTKFPGGALRGQLGSED